MMVSSAVGSLTGGAISSRRNLTSYTLIAASAFQLLGYGLMITLGNASPTPVKHFGFQVFLGLGFGLAMPSVTITVQLEVEPRWIGKTIISFAFAFRIAANIQTSSRNSRRPNPNALSRRQHWSRRRRHRV